MKHGNYQVINGKVHQYRGQRDPIYGGVYECGMAMSDSQHKHADVLTKSKPTCKKCIKSGK
mgnify:CR=1 FL=1